jgi:hypothetical protein
MTWRLPLPLQQGACAGWHPLCFSEEAVGKVRSDEEFSMTLNAVFI